MAQQRKSFFYRRIHEAGKSQGHDNTAYKHPFVKKNPLSPWDREMLSRKIAVEYLDISKKWS